MARVRQAGAPELSQANGGGVRPDAVVLAVQRSVEHIRAAIYNGQLKAGAPIRQEAVAAELGVSRIPIRMALQQLEAEGLVTTRPHSGARVAFLDYEECLALYKIRERLDPLGMAESVAVLDADDIEELAALVTRMEALSDDEAAWMVLDRQFHLACYRGAHPRIQSTIESYWNATQQYRRPLLQSFESVNFDQVNAEHRLIVEAVRTRDERLAEQAIAGHIARSRARLAGMREFFDT